MDPSRPATPARLRRDEALAPKTTLEVGGPARCWLQAEDERALIDAAARACRAFFDVDPVVPDGRP